MDQLELVEVCPAYAKEIWAYRQESLLQDADSEDLLAGCSGLLGSPSAESWIALCDLRKRSETCHLAGTTVPSHTYLAIRRADKALVGIIDLRHHIDHPVLGTWGGHCGYSVRPAERGRGYAREMLRLNLGKAKALGIERLLVTCSPENAASRNTILSNGGVYESTLDLEGRKVQRYWIPVL